MTEAELEKKCRAYAKTHGAWLAKWVSPGIAGVPDDILFVPTRLGTQAGRYKLIEDAFVVLIEFKREGKKATKLQQHYLDKLEDMGFETVVIDTFEKFEGLFK